MNTVNIRFSDIVKYFILGSLELLIFFLFVDTINWCIVWDKAKDICSSPFYIAALCIGLYFLGFLTQLTIQLFFEGNFLGTGVGEIAEYIRLPVD